MSLSRTSPICVLMFSPGLNRAVAFHETCRRLGVAEPGPKPDPGKMAGAVRLRRGCPSLPCERWAPLSIRR